MKLVCFIISIVIGYNLEKLYILECPLKAISGLDNCNHIKELYLYENEIKKIENINHLHKMEVLWLNGNKISRVFFKYIYFSN